MKNNPVISDNVLELIGNTPMLRLKRICPENGAEICAKMELQNPAGSVKDRAALAMIQAAEKQGVLKKDSTIIEATSGNTGISLAMISAVRGYKCTVVMPEGMSAARRYLLKAYGADVVLTPAEEGMAGAVSKAEEIAKQKRHSFMPQQFKNPANPNAHYTGTAQEIWDATEGKIDVFIAGVGTGGTITGSARLFKEKNNAIKMIAVEPKASAVLSGAEPGSHAIQGIGAGFVPSILERDLVDEIVTVSDLDAERMVRRLSEDEGLLIGPSSGANVHAALQVAEKLKSNQRIVTILCDTGERYLC
ncbi:MAG: cysteine synthase A [Myxococcales bacterium]|nr:MAG: cysteine synthase A [Myxococcales bacterium]